MGKYRVLSPAVGKIEHMFVLGVDPGLTATGFGALRSAGTKVEAVAAGVIRTDPALPTSRRLLELYNDLTGLLAELRPEVVAVEQVFVNRNLATATGVVQAAGTALLAAAAAGMDAAEYSPSAIKAVVTGDGAANKTQMQRMVARRLGLAAPPRPADAADALAVALCHLQHTAGRWGRLAMAEAAR